ncbi:P-loop NTPase fold protein [Pseudomonas solani]|uniref:P-loop NTPase fold protein n=1 Tax=Pseudomonas solani TaxID=2731552 RepID=UPI0035BE3FA6
MKSALFKIKNRMFGEKKLLVATAASSKENKAQQPTQNSHIRDYLKHYLSLEHSPYYAVLISGEWGIGKTFLAKSILNEFLDKSKYSYISLYGTGNYDDIDAALYQSIYPALTNKGVKLLGRLGKAALKYSRIDGAIKLSDITSPSKDRLYIFDDLERSKLPADQVLGYINELVEHDGCKVLIIANESKLLENKTYIETREKLIGKTLEAQPVIEDALRHFLSKVSDTNARSILLSHIDILIRIAKQASAKNLRILQQSIWDFERLSKHLKEHHYKKPEGINALVCLFFCIAMEVKSGTLSISDIKNRPDGFIRRMQKARSDEPSTAIDDTQKKFPEIDIHDRLLTNDVLVDILFKGIINSDALNESLDQSSIYIDPLAEPAWRTVWHSAERDEATVEKAVIEMERKFEKKEYLDLGEILHVVGLRLWLSDISELRIDRNQVIQEAKNYIDHLYKNRLLPPINRGYFGDLETGYAGLGIYEYKESDFQDFRHYLRARQEQANLDSYPVKAQELLKEMSSDTNLFHRRLNWTNDADDNIYANIPLLAAIPPEQFASQLLSLPPLNRKTAVIALYSRYSSGNLERDLQNEKTWISEVYKKLILSSEKLKPITKYKLRNLVEHYLSSFIA